MKLYIYIMLLCIIASCNNATEPNDTIDVKSGVLNISEISYYPLQEIANLHELTGANVVLLLKIYTDNNKNTQPEPTANFVQTMAVFNNTNIIDFAKVNSEPLLLTNPVLFPQYFSTPTSWDGNPGFKYNQAVNWLFKYKGEQEISVADSFQKKIHHLYLDCQDSLHISEQLKMNWQAGNISEDKLYLSFRWYPSFSESKEYREMSGFTLPDTGEYTFSPSQFSQMQLPNYGAVQFILTRFRVRTITIDSKKIVLISLVESSVSAYIAK